MSSISLLSIAGFRVGLQALSPIGIAGRQCRSRTLPKWLSRADQHRADDRQRRSVVIERHAHRWRMQITAGPIEIRPGLTPLPHRCTLSLSEGRPIPGLRWRRAEPFEPDPGHAGEGTGSAASPRSAMPLPHRARISNTKEEIHVASTIRTSKSSPRPTASPRGRSVGRARSMGRPRRIPGCACRSARSSLSDPKEPPVRVYDPSGPYTETDARIDLRLGLPAIRERLDRRPGLRHRRGTRPPSRGQRQPAGGPARRGLPGAAHPQSRTRRPDRDAI